MPSHERWISKFQIKKYSWIFVPTEETIQYGLAVKRLIEEKWCTPQFYYHLRNGGHIKALREHMKSKYFLHLDIQDFFGHINRSRVTRCIKEYLPYEKAREIAVESTIRMPESATKKYILPFGFVQSPIIASVCLSKSALGRLLYKLANRNDFVVSIYMDDIIVSCNNREALNEQLEAITVASEKSSLPLNPKKQEGPGVSITAFNICMSHGLLLITNGKLDELMTTYSESTNDDQMKGVLNYILSVNPDQAVRLNHV